MNYSIVAPVSRARAWRICAIAGAAIAALTVVLSRLSATTGHETPFLFLVPIVLAAGVVGGLVSGLFTTAIATVAGAVLLPPAGFDLVKFVYLAFFLFLGTVISLAGEYSRRAHARVQALARHLGEREARLTAILDIVPDALIVIDERGLIQSFSPAAERLFGWTAAEVTGRNVSLLMPSPYREQHDGYIMRYLQTGQGRIIGIGRVVVGARKDGATFPMQLAVAEIKAADRLFCGFVRDLTERHETEAQLRELQAELVHVSRLTALGEMATALAHELNQPLSAIANYLRGSHRLLDAGADKARIGDALDKAAAQALRAGQIIGRLRDFVARGEVEQRPERLSKLIEEASALALVGAREQGVRVSFNFDHAVDLVDADKVQVQQVVLNLIRNAIEEMQSSPRRELTITTTPHPPGMALVTVMDTGPGISEEVMARLFQPFVTTKRHGMGIGLSISRTIIEAHGGTIWAEPNPGGGATFSFTLRLVTEDANAE